MSFILHHYPLSPYSEKIRAMFGYTDIPWQSCLTSEAPPRGKLDLLSGGYSRIPVAQIGSDIFCDSNLIADEIAAISKQPALANQNLNDEDLSQRRWIETKLFFACVNRAFSFTLIKRIVKEKGLINLGLFLKDRIQMGAKATISTGSPKSAPKHIAKAMEDIALSLGHNDFIGGEKPSLLDFAAYHCFWFLSYVGEKNDLEKHQKVRTWYLRMQAFSSTPSEITSIDKALAEAKNSEPRTLDERFLKDHRIGSQVVIAPSDYRQVPVTGTLAGVDDERWIILREEPETGPLHLHFPTHAVDVTIRLPND